MNAKAAIDRIRSCRSRFGPWEWLAFVLLLGSVWREGITTSVDAGRYIQRVDSTLEEHTGQIGQIKTELGRHGDDIVRLQERTGSKAQANHEK